MSQDRNLRLRSPAAPSSRRQPGLRPAAGDRRRRRRHGAGGVAAAIVASLVSWRPLGMCCWYGDMDVDIMYIYIYERLVWYVLCCMFYIVSWNIDMVYIIIQKWYRWYAYTIIYIYTCVLYTMIMIWMCYYVCIWYQDQAILWYMFICEVVMVSI